MSEPVQSMDVYCVTNRPETYQQDITLKRTHRLNEETTAHFGRCERQAKGLLHPSLRANPSSKGTDLFCRLPLSTLFQDQRLFTLGTWCGNRYDWLHWHSLNQLLGVIANNQDTANAAVLWHRSTLISGWSNSKASTRDYKEKRPRPRCRKRQVGLDWCCHRYSRWSQFGNINPMLFRDIAVYKKPLFKTTAWACLLESTNSCTNTVHMKAFPASVLKVLIWVLATTTKICSTGRFSDKHTFVL